jgi:hypothetical protein
MHGGNFGLFCKPNIEIKRPIVTTMASTNKNKRISLGNGSSEITTAGIKFPKTIDTVLARTAIEMIVDID